MTSQLLLEEMNARTEAIMIASELYWAGELVTNHHSHYTAMGRTVPPLYDKPWHKDNDHTPMC
jgi:hypothetical protein